MDVHYRHFRNDPLQKDYTLCGVVSNKGTLLIGLAIRNPKDMFVKSLGREVSYGHAHMSPVAELVMPTDKYSGHVFAEFAKSFVPVKPLSCCEITAS